MFRKRIKIAPGIKINTGKKGISSLSVGPLNFRRGRSGSGGTSSGGDDGRSYWTCVICVLAGFIAIPLFCCFGTMFLGMLGGGADVKSNPTDRVAENRDREEEVDDSSDRNINSLTNKPKKADESSTETKKATTASKEPKSSNADIAESEPVPQPPLHEQIASLETEIQAKLRIWTEGKSTITAAFVSSGERSVHVKKEDGNQITIQKENLSRDDLAYIDQEKKRHKDLRLQINQLKAELEKAGVSYIQETKPSEFKIRQWTSAQGQHTFEGKFVGFDDGNVTLETRDGSQITVRADKISKHDHLYIVGNTGWGRVWETNGGEKLIADLLKVKNNSVILEKIDGSESELQFGELSKSDRNYADQRRANDLDFKDTDFMAKAVSVKDGDTIVLLIDKKQHTLRLNAIDSPELGQAFSQKSKQKLSTLVFGKQVDVKTTGKDKYGRLLGDVTVNGKSVNEELLSSGLAWHYKKYSRDSRLAQIEENAKSKKVGLWSEQNPIAPWDFRTWGPAKRRQYAESLVAKEPKKEKPSSKRIQPKRQVPVMSHWLNTSSNVRHNRSCRWYRNTKNGRRCSGNEGKACGICGG